jgi:hypothetical protein
LSFNTFFSDGGATDINVLNDNFYTQQMHEMAFINQQHLHQQQQLLPLNIMSCNQLEQAQQLQCQTLPRHLDVVPFDTVPPCDDCLKRARYKGSYGSECQGTSGADCVLLNNQSSLTSLTSTIKDNVSTRTVERRFSCEEKTLRCGKWTPIIKRGGSSTKRSTRTSTVTADVEFDPTDTCPEPVVNVVKEPDTLELVDTVESSV